ncbi:GNAT family N-acetyltransferase [Actinomycetospora straminea]|uniref:GNAT family N-acetyltransferase n=1 Tax=Actinomycetospora straminea TaxID=663607 RepID=A0ABP9DUJ5_9PSEU|nr:GNAT family N-acetyltransferase [Actinomycetospora straminea]MDD7932457.1 GNAT family N-acetyltransferase [Actinomycetospora straminea]
MRTTQRGLGTPPTPRTATDADVPAIAELMRASVRALFPLFYDAEQTAAAEVHIAHLDRAMIADGTYYVHEDGGEVEACGGWSRRARLYTGSGDRDDDARLLDPATEPARVRAMFVRGDRTRRGLGRAILQASVRAAGEEGFTSLVLMATLPGVPLYTAFGFTEVRRVDVPTPAGVTLAGVEMARPITPADLLTADRTRCPPGPP